MNERSFKAPRQHGQPARLSRLTVSEKPAPYTLDRLTRLAAKMLGVPVALIWLFSERTQALEPCPGTPQGWAAGCARECARMFCAHVVATGEPLCIADTREHPLFLSRPGEGACDVAAVAGVPMITLKGSRIGVFAVVDTAPRLWSADEIATLEEWAALAAADIEVPRSTRSSKAIRTAPTANGLPAGRGLAAKWLQVQKMECVGRIARSVLHSFNSDLTAILGYAALLQEALPADVEGYDSLGEVVEIAQRASALSRQLLTFARPAGTASIPLNLNDLIRNLYSLLRYLAGKTIDVVLALDPYPGLVQANAGQLEQVLVNLVLNARATLPNGGQITITTATGRLDGQRIRTDVDQCTGSHALLIVSDTGTGMDDTVKQHLFEPFFTTRAAGQGTGLGLAACYGIVKQHGGHLQVDSSIGAGTTITIALPRCATAFSSAG